jgi:DNA-binding CsgD family transcriptional regulator
VKESAVLGLIARGFTYDETAQRLGLSSHTVHTHVRNIYGKLDARNKTEALSQARALGWLE